MHVYSKMPCVHDKSKRIEYGHQILSKLVYVITARQPDVDSGSEIKG